MRIISQYRTTDVPYDSCVLWIEAEHNAVYCSPVGEENTSMQMARYSTMEKCEKALRKMRNQYMEGQVNTYFVFPKEDEI